MSEAAVATHAVGKSYQTSRALTDLAATSVGSLLLACIGLATGPLLARILGPVGRGRPAAIPNVCFVVATLALVGLTDAVTYWCAREPQRASTFTVSAVVLALMICPLFIVGAYVFMPMLLAAQTMQTVFTARAC